jgi:hypothetical protein
MKVVAALVVITEHKVAYARGAIDVAPTVEGVGTIQLTAIA